MSQTETEILEILHLAIHKTPFSVLSRADGEISQKAMTLNDQLLILDVL